MNKKILILCAILLLVVVGCAKKDKTENKENPKEGYNIITEDNKSLVLYFSATGTTEGIAKKISEQTNSDIIEIIPEEKYTESDLDYNNDCRANKEQNDDNARPKIKNEINIDQYDTIYIGYPIWWGTYPKIILTLLDSINFEGKNVALFCTSGSSGIEESYNSLQKYNSKINYLGAKRFSSSASDEEISSWVSEIQKNGASIMYVKANGKTLEVTLENNSSVTSLVEKLKEKDLTINMSDYGNFEKVGDLDFTLPTNDQNITTTPGDVILYQGKSITIYYDKNEWNFTKLGTIKGTSKEELLDIFGTDDVTVTFSLNK